MSRTHQLFAALAVSVRNPHIRRAEVAWGLANTAEWAHFVAAVAGEAKVPALQDHVVLHQVVDAIYRSAQDRRDVVL